MGRPCFRSTISNRPRATGSKRCATRICAAFEAIEREAGSDAAFEYIPWDRDRGRRLARRRRRARADDRQGVREGRGQRLDRRRQLLARIRRVDPRRRGRPALLRHRDQPGRAHGQSARPRGPYEHPLPDTTRRWFGGGADLNPAIPYAEDTDAFHARLRAACAAHDPTFYPRFSKWAEEYFWLPHRNVARGVGGIFFDRLEDHFDGHFAFTRDVGEAFLDIFPQIVRRRMDTPFDEAERRKLLEFRGRYVEFNLLYDRGTLFGLKTGGNIDAILMSLPPLASWA